MGWQVVTADKVLRDEESLVYRPKEGGSPIAIFFYQGAYYAIDDTCPHQTAPLSDGIILNGKVRCPLHASYFELATGVVEGGPCRKNVRSYPTRVENSEVQVLID